MHGGCKKAMKLRNIFLILFTVGMVAVAAIGQGRTNTLERNCASSTTKAKVEIQNGGKVNIQPCTTKDIDLTAPAANINLGVSGSPKYVLVRTVTAAGTTGNQTINKPAGTVNFAAGASAVTRTKKKVKKKSIKFWGQRKGD